MAERHVATYLNDHLAGSVHGQARVLECWTALTAIAVAVPRISVGPMVLNVANLIRTAFGIRVEQALASATETAEVRQRKRLLVADDSVTTLGLEKSILEGAGYDVTVAANGQTAWELLQSEGADLLA